MVTYSFSLANTFGALEIGVAVAIFLFGVVTVQTFMYYQRFPDDRLHFKTLVRSAPLLLICDHHSPSSGNLGHRLGYFGKSTLYRASFFA